MDLAIGFIDSNEVITKLKLEVEELIRELDEPAFSRLLLFLSKLYLIG